MRFAKLILWLLIAVLAPVLGMAQGNTLTLTGAGAPTGTCAFIMQWINSSNGDTSNCQAGAWQLIASGGGSPGAAIGSSVGGGTANSVLFVGAGPVLAQDNANFFWDGTGLRLGANSFSSTSFGLIVAPDLAASGPVGQSIAPIATSAAGSEFWGLEIAPDLGGSANFDKLTGIYFSPLSLGGAGVVDEVYGIDIDTIGGNAVRSIVAGIRVRDQGWGTTGYGLLIDSQTNGLATTFAIQTGLGKVGFGDTATITKAGIATTPTDAAVLTNTTAADGGATLQYSPSLRFTSSGWDSNDSVARAQDWRMFNVPTTSTGPTSYLSLQYSNNGAAFSERYRFRSNGTMEFLGSGGASGFYAISSDFTLSSDQSIDLSAGASFILAAASGINLDSATDVDATITADKYATEANCSDSAGDAACGAAPAGSVVIDATDTTTVVSTTAVTANSQIFVTFDSSLGTRLSVTCNTTAALPFVTARTATTSFTISLAAGPTVDPACFSFFIIN